MAEDKRITLSDKKYLVFKGGGGKGNTYLGSLKFLEELKDKFGRPLLPLRPENSNQIKGISGASAGAITALSIALGMSVEDIKRQSDPNYDSPFKGKGFKFDDFMLKDAPNPGAYKAIEVIQNGTDFTTRIGYAADSIYKDEHSDLRVKQIKNNIQGQVLDPLEELTGREIDKTELERKKLKKLAEIRTHIAGGAKKPISDKPTADPELYRLNFRALPELPLTFAAIKLRAAYKNSPKDPVLKKFNDQFNRYWYNILYDRGLFCGTHIREYFEKLINFYLKKYHSYEVSEGENITFLQFHEITKVDLRVTGTNMTAGECVLFSSFHTPFFPVGEAVAISMNIPGVFKPIYIRNKKTNGEEITHENSNLKTGLYVDGGFLNNLPLSAFHDLGAKPDEILGFRVIEGPDPNLFDPKFAYFYDYEKLKEEERKLYGNYVVDYIKEHGIIPPRKEPAKKGMIAPVNRSIFDTTLFSVFGYLLDTVLTDASNDEITPENIENLIDVYSYHIGTMDFTPNKHLLQFVENRAYERTRDSLNFENK